MVYVVGAFGFICGFVAGQYWLLKLLKDRPREELLNSARLKWTYGLLNWIVAGVSSYAFVFIYKYYFG